MTRTRELLHLPRRTARSVAATANVTFTCTSGSVWVTLDGDARDIILEAGDSFTPPERRHAVIYAFEPSTVALQRGGGADEHAASQRMRTTAQVAV